MLFLLKAHLEKPAGTSNKEFYGAWKKESEAALEAYRAGAIKAIWKAAGTPDVYAVLDLESGDALDQAILNLPLWKLGVSHFVTNLEITPLRPYENWAEDLKTLAQG
ncbi:MAG: muconolactone Delta-isomerase family protein [Candidatus Binatia bacterium]|jgi:muconolactone delta-isomerase